MNALLITGTDTEVGKTVATAAIAAYHTVYHSHQSLGLMKLLQTGAGDRWFYEQLFGEVVIPLSFAAPLAPPLAATKEGRNIDLGQVWQDFQSLTTEKDFVLVEALGGLGSPVTYELTVADIAASWRLPTILVVPVKLGAIAQTVANVALARQFQVDLRGIILNCVQPCSPSELEGWTPIDLIESLTNMPILGTIPYLQDINNLEQLAQVVTNMEFNYVNSKVK